VHGRHLRRCGFLTISGECYRSLRADGFKTLGQRMLDALVGRTAERKPQWGPVRVSGGNHSLDGALRVAFGDE
jgi:hypothetical protein